jgi:hypothetical protein
MVEIKEMLDKLEYGFTIKEQIHQGYLENYPSCPFGKYQYILESSKGMISLIELPNYSKDGETWWEIYCLNGNLFEDVERFTTKELAIATAKEYLCP